MKVDLHNHTSFCNHATGSMEEYVEKAIEEQIDVFGFSCHNPMKFDAKYRMSFSQLSLYLEMIETLKEKYASKICLKSALEFDYLPQYLEDSLLELPLDYRIGSVHFLGSWGFDNPEFIGEYAKRDINKMWEDYYAAIEEMAKSGLFDIVGHIDLLKIFKFYPTKDLRKSLESALRAIKKSNMVVEMNAAGFRKEVGEQYPSRQILEMCLELEIPITFGSDAHAIEQIGFKRESLEYLAKEVGFSKCVTFTQRQRDGRVLSPINSGFLRLLGVLK